jgi:5'-methylthioadenosine nucleosidase
MTNQHPAIPGPERPRSPIGHVCLLIALQAEADPLIRHLGLAEGTPPVPGFPMRRFGGTAGGLRVDLLTNGTDARCGTDRVGTDAATLAATTAVLHLRPHVVVNAGTCGGFQARGGAVGDLYLATGHALYHDRRIPIPHFELQATGRWPVHSAPALRAVLGAKPGIVTTGNSLDFTPTEAAFFEREAVHAKDMEACAIAQVCALSCVPFVAVKAVTDLVDHPEPVQEAFLRNLRDVSAALGERLAHGMRWLGERPRTVDEL